VSEEKKPTDRRGPVLIELEAPAATTPADAPAVPDAAMAEGRAMRTVASLTARRGWGLGGFLLASALSLVTFLTSVAAWTFVAGLLARNPVLGWVATVLFAAFLLAVLLIVLREAAAYARLARLDLIRVDAAKAVSDHDLSSARRAADRIVALYAHRPDTAWGRDRLAARRADLLDAETLLQVAEADLLGPLDQAARREIETAARQVAAVTALVPLALADVAAALLANVRMVRRIAEIYGGRSGALGSWRLLRAVMTHLVATGAVAVGDDLIHSVAGGGLLSKLSRRFGEGVINGALTARVGIAAMEVCRPLPFAVLPRPRVSNLIARGLAGLFGRAQADAGEKS
jgi:putative membrane protein